MTGGKRRSINLSLTRGDRAAFPQSPHVGGICS